MSIWKSPVFYFGILLVVVVTTALAAPFIVNWNSYRATIETYGKHILGRELSVNGNISARLFPWPNLTIEEVHIGNPNGISGPAILTAKTISLQLNLAGLLAGDIFVESIDIDQPVVTLARLDDAQVNWLFVPDQNMQDSKLLSHVKLDKINATNGVLRLQDMAHHFSTTLTHVNGTLSAPEFYGPWNVRGTAKNGDVPLAIAFTSNPLVAGQPLKFGLRVEPQDGAYPATSIEGALQDLKFSGKMRVAPMQREDGKQDLEQQFSQLQMQADVDADFNHIELKQIQITPNDTHDNGTLIEGSAKADFDDGTKVWVQLKSPRVNLDSLFGDQSLRVWNAGGVMALLNSIMQDFPAKFDLDASLDSASISAAGENLENFKIRATAEKDAIRIVELSTNLPGRSRMKFSGIAFPGEAAAELGGTLALESNDTRALASWLWPEGKTDLDKIWVGSRGRLKVQSDVTWSGKRFGFQNLDYELDGERGSATLSVQLGKLSSVNLKLNAANLNLDNYVSGKASQFSKGANPLAFLQSDTGFEKRIAINANTLRLNGVDAKTVALEFESSLSGFEVKKLNIGSVEGASLQAHGLILQGPDGPSGDIISNLTAENPRGFIRLLGFSEKGVDPSWVAALGPTNLQASLNVKPGATEPRVTFDMQGNSGALQITTSGDVRDLTKGQEAALGFSAEVSSANSANLAALVGLAPQPSALAGKISLTASGTKTTGFRSILNAEIYGAVLHYDGHYKATENLPIVKGNLQVLAPDVAVLGGSFGLPFLQPLQGKSNLNMQLETNSGTVQALNIFGELAGQHISGKAHIQADGKLYAEIAIDHLNLRDALTASFMPWRGKAALLADAFSQAKIIHSGEVWLHPTVLETGFGDDVQEAVIGVSYDQDQRHFGLAARGKDGEPLKADIDFKKTGEIFEVEGSLHVPVQLEKIFKTENSTIFAQGFGLLEGTLKGTGRSPLAVLTGMTGEATYVLRDASLPQLSPQNFYDKIKQVKTTADLKTLFDELFKPPGVALMAQQYSVKNNTGILQFDPLAITSGQAELVITPKYEFSTGEFETNISISSPQQKELPSIIVAYVGQAGAMRQRSDVSAVANTLGFNLMAQDLAELERVQKEQERLAANEAAQQKLDEEKFAAFQAQRNELRLRIREQKVFAQQRRIMADTLKANLDKAIKEGASLNELDIKKYLGLQNSVH
jgi:AsmA family